MLHHVEVGDPDGRPAVFVHGFMSSNLQWEPNLERLGRALRMILVEQPGHGDSPTPDDPESFGADAVVAELDRIRAALGIERWWLVGHSMGGAVCVRYALTHPDRSCGVVFTNSRAVFGVGRGADRDDRPREARLPTVEERSDLRHLPFHPIHAKRFPDDLQQRMVAVADAMDPATIRHVGAASATWRSREQLDQLAVPVLLVTGTWESAFRPWVAEARHRIPDLTVVELEGGHSINIEQPEPFDRAVLDFVDARS